MEVNSEQNAEASWECCLCGDGVSGETETEKHGELQVSKENM